ncbi:MBL fold metallo-hydrolase [Fibrella sp. HMF5335]|uniref:MBL fold metallo-hydrolase n=1 Tax=Fibrella rubiginis TaxID=2817060 RepID=A0A939GEV5_9BACT|nr:MBL fold metallo-hydrolase [Fibrella rubiginis]MBO0935267.1 MBL fold metallo-hydrolase [Fibrella rubiginis]
MNQFPICTTCGTQYRPDHAPELGCPICLDDRQYVPETGQTWTSLSELDKHYSVIIRPLQAHLYELKMVPTFAIGQRALLLKTPEGNILWDCIALLNEPTVAFIRANGGLRAIAFSHPHYYTTMHEWAETFDCPIYIHEHDQPWIYGPLGRVRLWSGAETALWSGVKLINVGGHFPESSILHVPFLSAHGTLLCGDTFYIAPSKRHIAVMYSYPNRIPLPIAEVQRIKALMQTIPFDAMHGFYDDQNIDHHAKTLLFTSLDRYR